MTSEERMYSTSLGVRTILAMVMVLAGACGGVDGKPPDAPVVPPDVPPDMAVGCSTLAFGAPRLVPGVNLNTAATEVNPRLTADELGLYFVRVPGAIGQWDIYLATRAQIGGDFGTPVPVGGVNGAATDEFDPTLTADGLTMYMDSSRVGNGDVFVATRTNVALDFSAPVPVSAVNTTDTERGAYVLPNGRAVYFSRYGALTGPNEKIYRAPIGSTGVGAPVEVAGLPAGVRALPVVTPDELTIYFASGNDIWMARRAAATEPFGTATLIDEVSLPGSGDEPGWISSDGCTLVFASNRSGSFDLYIARRGE
jgi:hypothetical protein